MNQTDTRQEHSKIIEITLSIQLHGLIFCSHFIKKLLHGRAKGAVRLAEKNPKKPFPVKRRQLGTTNSRTINAKTDKEQPENDNRVGRNEILGLGHRHICLSYLFHCALDDLKLFPGRSCHRSSWAYIYTQEEDEEEKIS